MTASLRERLARDGIFNTRDLGGLATRDGQLLATDKVIRGDALQRVRSSLDDVRTLGVVRVLDLRDERERDADGVFQGDGIEVQHHPVLDPTFAWYDPEGADLTGVLVRRYQDILGAFGPRFAGALTAIAETAETPDAAVAFHCAVGKDRTGLLAALLLSALDVPAATIVADYARSSAATAVQVNWLWSFGLPGGQASDDDLARGVWSARPETMATTLAWIDAEFGDTLGYLRGQGLDDSVVTSLRKSLLVEPV
jgi:protein-tyrosine phosphatase